MKRIIEGKDYTGGVNRTLVITDLRKDCNVSDKFDNLVRLTILNSHGSEEATMLCEKQQLKDAISQLK